MNFLVVDDSPLISRVLADYLKKMGHACTAILNSGEVEPWLDQNACDAVILDLMMPRLNGLALTSNIRKRFKDLPIVIFTSFGFDEEMMKATREAGANGYISKGLGPSDIYMALMRTLNPNYKAGVRKTG